MIFKNRKFGDLISNLMLSLGSICFFIVLAELSFRLLGIGGMPYEQPRYLYRTSDTLGYEFIPGAKKIYKTDFNFNTKIKINSLGLRDHEYAYEKPAGTLRILILGDSFTAGFQVDLEDTYPKVLDKILSNYVPKNYKYEVINSGVCGYDTVQEFQFLKERGYKFKPDIVVVGFLMSNDVEDNFYGSNMTVIDGWLAFKKNKASNNFLVNLKTFVKRYSRLYNFITNRIKDVSFARVLLTKMKIVSPDLLTYNLDLYSNLPNEKIEKEWESTRLVLREINNFVKNMHSKLLVVAFPCQYQVEKGRWELIMEQYKMKKEDYDIDKPQKILIDIADKEGIPVLDLTDSFRIHASKGEHLYIESEYHWNKAGHYYAAEEIYNFLKDDKWLN